MQNSVIISNLSKEYSLANNSSRIKSLDNISLAIRTGETVGIIGKNGSGKSTLLKIISGLTKPTSGTVKLQGDVSSILDIGSNFTPELTGLENAEMHLRINGFSVKKSAGIIKEIHDFSGVGDFFYQPIKTYSNGMFLRLAFSVVFNIPGDILVLDEVLSVGDEEFRMKSFEFIKQLRAQGKTIVLVSHSRQEILELCTQCIWLDNGKVAMYDSPLPVISEYFESQMAAYKAGKQQKNDVATEYETEDGTINVEWNNENAPGSEGVFLRRFEVLGNSKMEGLCTAEPIFIRMVINKQKPLIGLNIMLIFYSHFQQPVFTINPLHSLTQEKIDAYWDDTTGNFELSCTLPPNLLNEGEYYISIRYSDSHSDNVKMPEELFRIDKAFKIKIKHPKNRTYIAVRDIDFSILPYLDWDIQKT